MCVVRERISVHGIVQGVGFRPFVCRLAQRHGLSGWVRNTSEGVLIEVEGPRNVVGDFQTSLVAESPPQAHIVRVSHETVPTGTRHTHDKARDSAFVIAASDGPTVCKTLLSPDLATCGDCLAELMDPHDRRADYPFINCTNCGPRFSIILGVPYDRPRTTMRGFQMCPDCSREYHETADRRFHAQPNACPRCGPRVQLIRDGENVSSRDPFIEASEHLRRGGIVAVKGVGGYHLACDATSQDAVSRLRQRKGRGKKPLALMVKDLEVAERLVLLSPVEKEILTSVQAPILLLEPRAGIELRTWIAADAPRLGIMLPYSPLHHLLCKAVDRPLVMTSGNLSEEPLAYEDQEAARRLGRIADLFLTHNRPIARPCDDSVAVVWRDRVRLLRRSRGYVPRPIPLPGSEGIPPFLTMGGDLKSTFCLVTQQGMAFPSQHLGDLETPESQRNFCDSLRDLCELLDASPQAIVIDPHPNYYSSRLAERIGLHLPVFTVQHHEAHFAACLAENDVQGSAIGISWDGTGYGSDGCLWGGEFFVGDAARAERVATFRACRLPGGERAIREPWRVAYARLFDLYGDAAEENLPPALREIPENRRRLVRHLLARDINCPVCTSVGRLFDAVAAIVGLRQSVTFEAEAAVALEACQVDVADRMYPFRIDDSRRPWVIDTGPMVRAILANVTRGTAASEVSGRFHGTLALICAEVCRKLRTETALDRVAVSGGAFQNLALLERVVGILETEGFQVFTHAEVPANDGGISYGQAAAAVARWKQCVWPSP